MTEDDLRRLETRAVLGAEPIIARLTGTEMTNDAPPPGAAWFYEAVPRDICTGESVLP